jgi:hypothetical protein
MKANRDGREINGVCLPKYFQNISVVQCLNESSVRLELFPLAMQQSHRMYIGV